MLYDKKLESRLLNQIQKLEEEIDGVAPTPLRHKLSEQVVTMRKTLVDFNQADYDNSLQENES